MKSTETTGPHQPPSTQLAYRLLGAAACLALIVVVLRSAWTSDDGYINYRACYNFLHGLGPNFNPGERVQVYTNPLWFWLEVACFKITGEYFVTGMLMGIVATAAALWLLVRRTHSGLITLGAALCLLASKAFIDYSTAGLENPLGFVLVILVADAFTHGPDTRGKLFRMALAACLLSLTRQDLILVAFPALLGQIYISFKAGIKPKTILLLLIAAFTPLILWEAISLVYYGFPFPNTYYAKVRNGIPGKELVRQGAMYLYDLILNDPSTAIGLALAAMVSAWAGSWRQRLLAAGIGLYIAYVISVGGDFMTGRFFAIPFSLAVWLLVRIASHQPETGSRLLPGIGALLLLLSFTADNPTLLYGREYPGYAIDRKLRIIRQTGIADERLNYFPTSNLTFILNRNGARPYHSLTFKGEALKQAGVPIYVGINGGFLPFYAGTGLYFLDIGALADPLLSRLPEYYPNHIRPQWRPGHTSHNIPAGYQETLLTGRNLLQDDSLRTYYQHLQTIVRGPLFTAERFREIGLFNIGHYNHLVKNRHYYPGEPAYADNSVLQARFPARPLR